MSGLREQTESRESEVMLMVCDLVAENRRLRRHVEVLNAKCVELSDPEPLRKAYRTGYLAGRSAQRRGAVEVTNPEVHARGWMRAELERREAEGGNV